jgi:CRISPR/Cas system CMR-associated protein Cmr3 (group 5 of RAMP superfamily)
MKVGERDEWFSSEGQLGITLTVKINEIKEKDMYSRLPFHIG